MAGTNWYVNAVMWRTPARSASSAIRRASAAFNAMGFSHSTCLPERAAAIAMSGCRKFGVAMITAWTSSRATTSRHSAAATGAPVNERAWSSVAGLASQTAWTRTSGHRARPGRWF